VIGDCVIVGKGLKVLFDTRVTHSFVSSAFVVEEGLLVRELSFDLLVLTPTFGKV